jgi:hypothetical protein
MARIKDKWVRNSAGASASYTEGVQNPRSDWKAATLAAANTHKVATMEALNSDRFKNSVSKSSTDYWQRMALAKGSTRWAAGIDLSKDNYEAGFAPYAARIQATTLPERGSKNSAQNYERSKKMGEALHAEKVARSK